MDGMDELKSLLDKIGYFDEDTLQKVEVGRVPQEILRRYRAWNKGKEQLENEMEARASQFANECRQRMEDEFGDREEQVIELKDEIWNEIADYLHVAREDKLSINIRTGMVSTHKDKLRREGDAPLQ